MVHCFFVSLVLFLKLACVAAVAQGQAAYWCSEGNFSNDCGHLSYIDAQGRLHEDVLKNVYNANKTLGITLQYATFCNGKVYAVCKQKYKGQNNRLVRIDPGSWAIERMGSGTVFDEMDNENRTFHFLAVSDSVGYLSSSDAKLYRVRLNDLSASLVRGIGWSGLEGREVGTMVLYRGKIVVEVYGQKRGYSTDVLGHELWVLNVENGEVIGKFSAQGLFNQVVTRDGRLLAVRVQKGTVGGAKRYELVQLDINNVGAEPVVLLPLDANIRPADFQTQAYSWSQGYVFASTRENKLYWNVENGSWDMHKIAMLDLDNSPLTPTLVYSGKDKFYGITRENPHDGSLWVNFNGEYGQHDQLVRLVRGQAGNYEVESRYKMNGSYYFSSCPFFEDRHAAQLKNEGFILVRPGETVDLCDYVEDVDGFAASVIFSNPWVVASKAWEVKIEDGHLLHVVTCDGAATLFVDAWSSGKSATITLELAGRVGKRGPVSKLRDGEDEMLYFFPGDGADTCINVIALSLKDVELNGKGEITKAEVDRRLLYDRKRVHKEWMSFNPDKGLYVRIDVKGACPINYDGCEWEKELIESEGFGALYVTGGLTEVRSMMDRGEQKKKFFSRDREEKVTASREFFFVGFDKKKVRSPLCRVRESKFLVKQNPYAPKIQLNRIFLEPLADDDYKWSLRANRNSGYKTSDLDDNTWELFSGAYIFPERKNGFTASAYATTEPVVSQVKEYKVQGELHQPEKKDATRIEFQPNGDVTVSAVFQKAPGVHDLTLARVGEGNLTVKRDGKELPNGAIVRKGEALTITAIAENGLALKSLTVNGAPFESGKTFTAGDGDVKIDVVFAKPYKLTVVQVGEGSLGVMRGAEKLSGEANLFEGDVLTITAMQGEGYALGTLTVNGAPFESGKTFTVGDGNVKIDVVFAKLYKLTVVQVGEGSLGVVRGAEKLSDGANLFEGDVLTITVMQGEGYALGTLTVNGVSLESGKTFTVGKEDVKVVVDFVKAQSAFVESQMLASVEALPNPCSDMLTLRGVASVTEWAVFTSQGRLVAGGVGNGNDVIEIATAHLAAGVYCVRLVASDGEKNIVVVKK